MCLDWKRRRIRKIRSVRTKGGQGVDLICYYIFISLSRFIGYYFYKDISHICCFALCRKHIPRFLAWLKHSPLLHSLTFEPCRMFTPPNLAWFAHSSLSHYFFFVHWALAACLMHNAFPFVLYLCILHCCSCNLRNQSYAHCSFLDWFVPPSMLKLNRLSLAPCFMPLLLSERIWASLWLHHLTFIIITYLMYTPSF